MIGPGEYQDLYKIQSLDPKGTKFGKGSRLPLKENSFNVGPGEVDYRSTFSQKGGVMLRTVKQPRN